MDLFYDPSWKCADDSQKYSKMLEKERIFDFLQGLNLDLDEVRGRLLGTKPLPSLREVFAEVRREESRKRVMLPTTEPNSGSALTAARKEDIPKDKQWCEHCNRPYHTKSTCWKLHGKPPNWKPKPKKDRSAYAATSVPTSEKGTGMGLTTDQIDFLQKLLQSSYIAKESDEATPNYSASMAQKDRR
ncbi:uncharacterized protein LOC127807691 [Diospyros lotus]|uniref:uncharacterized protein LOC127807691 n=1 Tax=Diospyros lotus TaxID=55363 RepID=UPI0022590D70|nr:uncharacterized protein LOC127807691 [Diospyros lotus]XP_052201689.1 uncharacterized protein LOC127807691 [Diospyros lotus]